MVTKACKVSTNLKNTGVDCQIIMKASAMFWAVPSTFSMTDEDLEDPVEFFKQKMHAQASERIYPLFGNKAPIRYINNDKEADVIVTHDDGSRQMVRYGFLNRSMGTTSGGLCYAQALQSFNESGYDTLEIDISGRMLVEAAAAANTYKGMITDFMYSPSPDLPDFRSVWKTWFTIAYNPQSYINRGVILDGLEELLALNGLIDGVIEQAAAATTTHIKIRALAECSEENLGTSLGSVFTGNEANFSVVNKATGVAASVTASVLTDDYIDLTGTFTSGQTYLVSVVPANELYTNSVEGYEFPDAIEITIP